MNKENAHLYLPLVKALADGKTVQVRNGFDEWKDFLEPSFTIEPYRYRIKPLSFPPKPEGMEWHNPDNLTPEQVGDGYRLLTTKENKERHPASVDEDLERITQLWEVDKGKWDESGCYTGNRKHFTYRLPLSTPYPDGSYVKDGQLVKPWVPKFKVGDRVKERLTGVICKISTIREDCQAYETTNSGVPIDEYHLEPAPWSLPRHLPCFRPLRDGEEFHRQNEWKEEMLPAGFRPLLIGDSDKGEYEESCDGLIWTAGEWTESPLPKVGCGWFRTRRALPEPAPLPEPVKHVPLGPEDVTWGSVLRWKIDLQHETLMNGKSPAGIWIGSASVALSWSELMEECQIHRPGNLDANGKPIFEPCSKPA